ncbi:MAG: class I SAM-dependent methyltransferase, partial [Silvibacterium sp.]
MATIPRTKFGRMLRFYSNYGAKQTLERLVTGTVISSVSAGYHKWQSPRLGLLNRAALSMHLSASELLAKYFTLDGETLQAEFTELQSALQERRRVLRFPEAYMTDPESCFLLYGIVRSVRPKVILETGVADGHSSYFILNAMRRNNYGTLYSIDISRDVGRLVEDFEKDRWKLHILSGNSPKRSYESFVESLPAIDVFIHDSDHVYQWQYLELQTVWCKMAPTSIIACDDADWSFAFVDFCEEKKLMPIFLLQKRKVFGIALHNW